MTWGSGAAYPFYWVEVQVLDFAVLKEGCQADAVVGDMLLLADHGDVVFPCPRVQFQEFLSGKGLVGDNLVALFV
jgi:hypothetical protein